MALGLTVKKQKVPDSQDTTQQEWETSRSALQDVNRLVPLARNHSRVYHRDHGAFTPGGVCVLTNFTGVCHAASPSPSWGESFS